MHDKVAIITGAASGIGRVAVHRFVAEGATVTAGAVDAHGLDETIEPLPDESRQQATAQVADVSQAEQVEKVVAHRAVPPNLYTIDGRRSHTPGDGSFYYLRVTQGNGQMAWASPVWMGRRQQVAIGR